MSNKSRQIFVFFMALFLVNILFAKTPQTKSIEGYWTTISDVDNMPRSVVELYKRKGNIEGRIIKLYARPGDHDYCINCPEPMKNQPIKGLRIIWGLKPDGDLSWSGGKVLDPKKGKIYKCKMALNKSDKKLYVRGYIGISLFGRTQIWIRRKSA